MSLFSKLAIPVAFLTLLLVAIFTFTIFTEVRNTLKDQVIINQSEKSTLLLEDVEGYIYERSRDASDIAVEMSYTLNWEAYYQSQQADLENADDELGTESHFDNQEIEDRVNAILISTGPWDAIAVTDRDGQIIAGSHSADNPENTAIGTLIQAAHFNQIIDSGNSYRSDVIGGIREQPTMIFADPVIISGAGGDEIVGAVITHLSWTPVNEILQFFPNDRIALYNDNGIIIATNQDSLRDEILVGNYRTYEPVKAGQTASQFAGEIYDLNDELSLATAVRVADYVDSLGKSWVLVWENPTNYVFADINQKAWQYTIFLALLALLLVIVILFLTLRIIIGPIKRITNSIKYVIETQKMKKVKYAGHDEIGNLVSSFNTMIQMLLESRSDLEQKVQDRTRELQQTIDQVNHSNRNLKTTEGKLHKLLEDVSLANRRIATEKARDEAILQSIGEGLVTVDAELKVVSVNDAAIDLFGRSTRALENQPYYKALPIFDKNGQEVIAAKRPLQTAITEGKTTWSRDFFLHLSSERIIPVAITASPLKIDDQLIGGVVVYKDISQEKSIEELKTEVVSMAAHQLRTPLTAMKWYLEAFLNGDFGQLTAEQQKTIGEMEGSNQRMINLIAQLLNVSRLEGGRLKIDPKAMHLEDEIQSVIDEVAPIAQKRQCEITYTKPDRPTPTVALDPSMIHQVIHNLATNAIKYSKEGQCQVQINLNYDAERGYVVSVKDSGLGISKTDQKKIFQKFFRSDAAKIATSEGTGLGLYISKMIIELSGGKIWFTSEEGAGTTFNISIPRGGMKKQAGEKGLA